MSEQTIVLVGGPDSGKTNYLARLWEALRAGDGALIAPIVPQDIKYVEEALEHLLKGEFAPRSDKNFETSTRSFSIPLVTASDRNAQPKAIVVPDVTGELWKKAVETSEVPQQWMDGLKAASGALLFVRVGSEQNVDPLDWVTCAALLRIQGARDIDQETRIPTQVTLCELLRFLETSLAAQSDGSLPRVSVVVTAWDRLDATTAARGPAAYISSEYPMFAGRLADTSKLSIKVFGVSVVSGDFTDDQFRERFFEKDLKDSGYVLVDSPAGAEMQSDLTLPVAWVLQGLATQ
jgi:hypothetical protein